MFMALATSLVVLYCCATADILTKNLQQCFLFFIVVVIPGQSSGDYWPYSGIVKLGFTEVIKILYIFLIFPLKHRLWVRVRTASLRWF